MLKKYIKSVIHEYINIGIYLYGLCFDVWYSYYPKKRDVKLNEIKVFYVDIYYFLKIFSLYQLNKLLA